MSPEIDSDCIARSTGEARLVAHDPRRIAIAGLPQHGTASDSKSAEAAQAWPRKAGMLGDVWIGMKRIEISIQPIEQRLVRLRV
ncbi:hypothetical protein XH80_00535 [Bradyrhizobium sp. CCBAU 45384]|nr:hypothetical protein [Bradyrhizobium sp. CCBAU 45384]MDA9405334.1 hypothetical protein [Bradyrhizobium sp. CCBAU 45384]